jgi:hypothetical protein
MTKQPDNIFSPDSSKLPPQQSEGVVRMAGQMIMVYTL